jgi:hypothetical protein
MDSMRILNDAAGRRKKLRFPWNGVPLIVVAAALGACTQAGISNPIPQQPSQSLQAAQLIGGATKQITTDVKPVGGFLPHPELLVAGGAGQPALLYRNPGTNWSKYKQILLDPVTIWAGPNSEINSVPADQQAALANLFYSDLFNAL